MDSKQARILLDKINSLFNSIHLDDGGITSIERDLMMSYVRQFYELFAANPPKQEAARPTNLPDISTLKRNTPEPAPQERPAPQKRKYVPPRIIEIPDSLKDLEQPEEPQPEIVPPRRVERPVPPPPPPPQPKTVPRPQPVLSNQSDFDPLFEFKAAKELSEKLSERPIKDLTRALAINDRLLYMNELFGKDQAALNNTLQLLNKYSSIDEAKGLLINMADQFNWTDSNKLDTARSFIKLVRRRYF